MSMLPMNLRALQEGIMYSVKRRKGLGPRHARELADAIGNTARAVEKHEAKIAKLSAIVEDVAPERLKRKKRK